ncbi:unnamed protein product [Linum tenue]|uniref:Protein CMSS1 n=1 Tax=Linum tenue TaxID=586396 RepID=A0AAV0N1D6_9ROSI|nr:unnamed protein product [Linum tenue]
MGTVKAGKPSKSRRNPNKLGIRKKRSSHDSSAKKIQKKKKKTNKRQQQDIPADIVEEQQLPNDDEVPSTAPRPLDFFLSEFQSANGIQLSSLELESINEDCFMELSEELPHGVEALGKGMKDAFGKSWKAELCDGKLVDGKIEAGNPAVLFISASALRAIDLLRGVRLLTKECHAAKLFSKHMKVEEQVTILKSRVNFASGTPSRIKKLIDIEAMGLSRLKVVVVDLQQDVKGYSLLSLPQVREEFWDLYKSHIHPRVLQGDLRLCLFGPIPTKSNDKKRRRNE